MASLTYAACLSKIREHRALERECRDLADAYLYLSRTLPREYEDAADGHRETAREYAGVAWDMRRAMRPSRRMAA